MRRFKRRRAGCGGVDGHAVRRGAERGAPLGRQFQQALEHRRHPLAVGDAFALQQVQRQRGVEARHHVHRAAGGRDRQRKAQRSRVVQRRRRQVTQVRSGQVEVLDQVTGKGRRALEVGRQQRPPHALGRAGGARRVEHQRAGRLVGVRQWRRIGQQRLHGREAGDRPAQRHPGHAAAAQRRQGCCLRAQRRLGQHHAGVAVAHQVGQLGADQRGGHRRQVDAAAPAGPGQRQGLGAVAQQRGHVVTALQAQCAQHAGQPVGQRLQPGVAQLPVAADDGQPFGCGRSMDTDVHCGGGRVAHAVLLQGSARQTTSSVNASPILGSHCKAALAWSPPALGAELQLRIPALRLD
jgi:hypothetical protein